MTDSHILVASLLRSPVRYGMGDFMSLWVLALAGLKVGLGALVFIFMSSGDELSLQMGNSTGVAYSITFNVQLLAVD